MPLRPNRSPKCPHSTPPNGRAKIPTPRVANEAITADAAGRSANNRSLKINAAPVEKMK